MHCHTVASLTLIGRERQIRRQLEEGVPLQILAVDAGISLRTAYKWLGRFMGSTSGSVKAVQRSVVEHPLSRAVWRPTAAGCTPAFAA
jgi:hypothetical protein